MNLNIQKINGKFNPADILTKPVSRITLQETTGANVRGLRIEGTTHRRNETYLTTWHVGNIMLNSQHLCLVQNVIAFFCCLNKGYYENNVDRCFTNISGYEDNTLCGLDFS